MTPTVVRHSRVHNDLAEIYAFIAQDKIVPAEKFVSVAEESFVRLAEMPFIGKKWQSLRPHLANARLYPMPPPYRNYLVFYPPIEKGIEVFAVLNGYRNLPLALKDF